MAGCRLGALETPVSGLGSTPLWPCVPCFIRVAPQKSPNEATLACPWSAESGFDSHHLRHISNHKVNESQRGTMASLKDSVDHVYTLFKTNMPEFAGHNPERWELLSALDRMEEVGLEQADQMFKTDCPSKRNMKQAVILAANKYRKEIQGEN